jgi:hypothetical protein
MESGNSSEARALSSRRASPGRIGVFAAATAAFAIVLWGGYSHRWSWTGINGHTATLWDWLHLLLLPVAVGVLPIWVSRTTRVTRSYKRLVLTLTGAFALLVLIGYTVPWAWTGFAGNKLWDWLQLLALPLAVALTPVYAELRTAWAGRHSMMALLGSVVFAAVVLGGYLVPWAWTGFTGNTLWDWLHLLLLPLLIPVLVVPALMPIAQAGVVAVEDTNDAANASDGGADDPDRRPSQPLSTRSSQAGSQAGQSTPATELEHGEHDEPRSS